MKSVLPEISHKLDVSMYNNAVNTCACVIWVNCLMTLLSLTCLGVLERRAPPCPADELDISQCLLKALESDSDSPPWPSLHINMDNKVRLISYSLFAYPACTMRFSTGCVAIVLGRERRSSCLRSLCTHLPLQPCSPTTSSATYSRPRWRQRSGSVPVLTSM